MRLWLASRQIDCVRAHRDHIPDYFKGELALADQQRAADYTVARARFSRWSTLFEALIKLLLTIGGGLAALDALLRHVHWPEPWHGTLLVLCALLLLQLLGLPFALWRTFRIEARLRVQSHDAGALCRRSRQAARARIGAGHSLGARIPRAHAEGRCMVVGVGLVRVAGRYAGADMGSSALHRAALQSLFPVVRCRAQAARRGAPRALRLCRSRRRVRHGRLAPLGARQRLFHRHRAQQAHRLLRHPVGADQRRGNRGSTGA